MAHEVIPFPPRSSPPLPSPFASPLQRPGPQLFAELQNVWLGRINGIMEEDYVEVEWWSEESLDLSLDVSGALYFEMVSKVIF